MRGFGSRENAARASAAVVLGLMLALTGCDDGNDEEVDAGDPMTDAGDPTTDAGDPTMDAGDPTMDAGDPTMDAGDETDGGDGPDAGDDTDGGVDVDAGPVGGGSATSTQIGDVLGATPGTVALDVDDAVVTYVKPAIDDGVDGPGFFVQAEATGPALYVNVDPTSLTPSPEVGSVVDFQVTEVAVDDDTTGDGSNIVYAAAIDAWSEDSAGNDVGFLVQEVSAVDLVTELDDHFGELITLTADIVDDFGFAGTGFRGAQITSTGVTTASSDFRFRVPSGVLEGSDLGLDCTVAIGPTPLWRYQTSAQPSAWRAEDFEVTACPAPAAEGELEVTEIGYAFTDPDDDKEFVEIYNPSEDRAFDLGGCILSDENGPSDTDALTIPGPAIVGPGAYFVIAGDAATSEIVGDAVLPTGLGFGGSDLVELTCGGTRIDVVDWTTESFPAEMDDVSVQLDSGLEGSDVNGNLVNWCLTPEGTTYGTMGRRGSPGAANPPCPCPAVSTGLVFSEIDYDQSGADSAEFVEIVNVSGGDVALCDVDVVFYNGNGSSEYERVALSGTVPADGFVVVSASGSSVTPTQPAFTVGSIQNGSPDGVALVSASTGDIIDFITYEGAFDPLPDSGIPPSLNESIGTDSADGSLSRCGPAPADWQLTTSATPGASNDCPITGG